METISGSKTVRQQRQQDVGRTAVVGRAALSAVEGLQEA
ncbi:hypothetical protein Hamer_G017500 [Homarus americanus]|uniref:Uncharacterized protein n=1 Tax=Homarus americanus TaxID=6706 RepID=A0A8J5MQH6_HOMAM|nr:hypothetical protein Hamer_G017500 [Homarus americanus]